MSISSTILKYILSGIIASLVMFCLLAFFREVLGIWYLYSSTFAFILAFTTSFLLQKFWAFGNVEGSNIHKQLLLFLVVSLINLVINGLGMFILVDKFGVWYLVSQFFVTASIAVWSFFIYRVIFKNQQL